MMQLIQSIFHRLAGITNFEAKRLLPVTKWKSK